jgi:hypothetical protein
MLNMESDGSGGVFSTLTILLFKKILTKSFKFLIFSWKFFAIVLAFHIFRSFLFDPNSYTNNDLTLTQQYFEVVLTQLPKNILDLLFWICIIPLIILSMKEYMTGQQRLTFEEHPKCILYIFKINIGIFHFWKEKMVRYFVPLLKYKSIFFILDFLAVCFVTFSMFNFSRFQFTLIPESVIRIIGFFIGIFEIILGFILFLVPVIIVLENKTFIEGTKKSIDIIRNKLIVCLIFILLLNIINPSNISLLLLITSRYAAISGFDYFQLIQNPGFKIIQLILSSGWFIFYYAAIVGFYLKVIRLNKNEIVNKEPL